MEKITIKTAVKKEWNGKTFYNITTEDGRNGSSNDAKFLELIGKETECEVKDSGKEYQNIKQYYFNLPNTQNPQNKFQVKDWNYEKRKASLDFATRHNSIQGKNVLETAEQYFQYLNKK